uniref:Late nodulin n=1 Tax=Meloidogyne incognita TaxID=6306 RepID=A0A914MCZ6_MELIC
MLAQQAVFISLIIILFFILMIIEEIGAPYCNEKKDCAPLAILHGTNCVKHRCAP